METAEVARGELTRLRVGDLVEVRSADEIMATLDENGELAAMPFMPEMLRFCGQRLTVFKVASKLCDTMTRSGMRRMDDAVHLVGARCDGSAHDGCQAACLMYFKTAWLKPLDVTAPPAPSAAAQDTSRLLPLLTITSRRPSTEDGEIRYACQATEILRAAPHVLPVRDVKQYVDDVRSGNARLWWSVRAFFVGIFNQLQGMSQRKLPRWLRFRGGLPWGFLRGTAVTTPTVETGLRPGDLVRIKSREEILPTLNDKLLNRGMGFDAEMARFCGRTARVARRVTRIVDENTGKMLDMRNPCIVLEGIVCEGAFNASCPRAITSYWREIWLERIEEPA